MAIDNTSFSIVICTYNPDESIFNRLIDAVARLEESEKFQSEIIIVDNNSTHPIDMRPSVSALVKSKPGAKVIVEKKPGLTNARLAGAKAAKYDWVVFYDDDNEPEQDYLLALAELIENHTQVGCWGPGDITVEYTGEVKDWLQEQKEYFQERREKKVQFSASQQWQYYYPFGTGMVVRKEILEAYAVSVEKGEYSLNDRKGKSLSSGGDVQIVLAGLKMGFAAGTSPTLRLKHLIHQDKSNYKYLIKMIYGTASSYLPAHNQVFGEQQIDPILIGNKAIIKNIYGVVKMNLFKIPIRNIGIKVTQMIGETQGAYIAADAKPPRVLNFFQSLINYK